MGEISHMKKTLKDVYSNSDLTYQIEQETLQIEKLKTNLKLSNELSLKAIHTLSSFDDRLTQLEISILPIQTATLKLTQLNENVNKTFDTLNKLISYMEIATKEEPFVLAGPKDKKIEDYLNSVSKLTKVKEYLAKNQLKSSLKSQTQIVQVLKVSLQHQSNWLQTYLQGLSAPLPYDTPSENLKLPPNAINKLQLIMNSIVSTELQLTNTSTHQQLTTLVKVRSQFLVASFQNLAKASNPNLDYKSTGSTYQKGACPFIIYSVELSRFLEHEHLFLNQLFQGKDLVMSFNQTVSTALQQYLDTGEQLVTFAKKDLHNEIFLLFDILENLLENKSGYQKIHKLAERSENAYTNLVQSINTTLTKSFPAFLDDIKSATTKPTALSTDGTVHEMTSGAINFIKRLIDYPNTVEKALQSLTNQPCLQTVSTKNPCLSTIYFTNVIDALVTFNETKSKGYKPTLSALFQANNYYYILTSIHQVLSSYIDESLTNKLEKLIDRALLQYHESWKPCLEHLTDTNLTRIPINNNGKSQLSSNERSNVKEKFKLFNQHLEELQKSQKSFTIYDQQLKVKVIDQILKILVPLYMRNVDRFKTTEFSKNPEKYIKFDKVGLEQVVKSFFDSAS